MSLRQTFFTGIRWTGLSSLTGFLLGMVQIAILVRYLEKSDFAWVSLAGIFVNTGTQLQIAGINAAIVQKDENSILALASLYWVNMGIGIIFFVFIALFSPILAAFYQAPVLIPIAIIYGILFLFNAISVQYKALLQKNLQFRALSIGEICGNIIGFIMACGSAMQGYGAYALLAGYLSKYSVEALFAIINGSKYFVPRFVFDFASIRSYLAFSGFHLSERIVTQIGGQLDLLIIGKLLGSEALGVYDIFKRILVRPFNLINETFEKITFPVLSQLQARLQDQKKLFFQLLAHLSAVNLPLIIGLIIVAKPLIAWYFGVSWVQYTIVFQLLCGFCLLHYLLNPVDVLLLAQGRIQQWMYANLGLLPILAIAIGIGCQFELSGAALGNLIACFLFTWLVFQRLIFPSFQSNFWELFLYLRTPVGIALTAMLLGEMLSLLIGKNIGALCGLVIFTLIYCLLTWRFNKPIVTIIRQFLK